MRCCVEDEGLLALRSRPAGGGFKPPHAALAEDCRGERCGKGAARSRQVGAGKTIAADVSLFNFRWHQNRGVLVLPG